MWEQMQKVVPYTAEMTVPCLSPGWQVWSLQGEPGGDGPEEGARQRVCHRGGEVASLIPTWSTLAETILRW